MVVHALGPVPRSVARAGSSNLLVFNVRKGTGHSSLHNGHPNHLPGAVWRHMPLSYCDVQIKVPAHAWRCNVDQIDGLVVSCLTIPSFAHAENHPRRTRTRTSAERECLGSHVLSRRRRLHGLGQSVVSLAACAVALWPCAAHGPLLAAHQCVTPLASSHGSQAR